ncbi:methyltransferase domain-containing protein [Tenacibaculum sp. UWU-22]|uniref:methyltransferase domain-containing protein n=1 Tax=Tenacibaculum sp. UWU-22 TaxID=3234187 RepID=UPI0034DB66BB
MIDLNQEFWSDRYKNKNIGWDLGSVSTPIKEYIDQLTNKDLRILIPGGGNSYEAEYLFNKAFKNVFVADIAEEPLKNLKKRVPKFPSKNLLHTNFFDITNSFDLIIEQTFFCAINPKLRLQYVKKAHDLLAEKGKIVGLLFDSKLNDDHPPFGGNSMIYRELFTPFFTIEKMERAYNSEESRKEIELFIKLIKKEF